MATKTQGTPNDQKQPSFDPADFFADDDYAAEDSADAVDFGDNFESDGIDDGVGTTPVDDEVEETEVEETEVEETEVEEDEVEEAEAEETDEEGKEADEEVEEIDDADTADAEPEPPKRTGKPGHMIPKARLDHQIAVTREMQQRIAKLEQEATDARVAAVKAAQVPDEQIQGWLQEASQKALDGDLEDAAKLQSKAFSAMQSNRGESTVAEQKGIDADALRAQLREELKVDSVVERVMADYPMLNPQGEAFDEDLNQEALEYQDFFLSKGHPPATAVEKAVAMLSNVHGLKPVGYEAPAAPVAKKAQRNTKISVKDNLAVAGKQPAEPTNRRGNKATPEDTVDIHTLDDEQLLALPESVRARLRGD